MAGLQAAGCNALGLSGADGNAVTARRRAPQPVDYGFVGDIERVDSALLRRLLEDGMAPVFSAIMHDGKGHPAELQRRQRGFGRSAGRGGNRPDRPGFLLRESRGSAQPGRRHVADPRDHGRNRIRRSRPTASVSKGMIPKIENALKAVEKGVRSVTIRSSENLSNGIGTVIRNS